MGITSSYMPPPEFRMWKDDKLQTHTTDVVEEFAWKCVDSEGNMETVPLDQHPTRWLEAEERYESWRRANAEEEPATARARRRSMKRGSRQNGKRWPPTRWL